MDKHLWGVKHPYYCEGHNYYSNDSTYNYNSWSDFIAEMKDSDMDMNLLFRWDWMDSEQEDQELETDELRLFVMHQRIGRFVVMIVLVQKEDEPSVIEWLKPRFEHMVKLWQPFIAQPTE